ncbi:MAG: monovalent cation:proton antiporter-2 (CPA2) family protein [Gammaproteobacteria bacterium]|nr:monovalent cation:proton antiporter-2 (CPA2) family protein [Gammaproteobacteria bacterium]
MHGYLMDILFLLAAAVIVVPLFQTVKLGGVPGFVIAGVIVGPYGLDLVKNLTEFHALAETGVVFLLFVIGIELKPSRLWQMRRLVFGAGLMQLFITASALGLVLRYFTDISVESILLIAPALALSSTAFVLQLLAEKKLLTSHCGRVSISVLLFQDLAVVPLLALIPLLAMKDLTVGLNIGFALGEAIFILLLVILVGRYLLHPVLRRVALSGNSEIFTSSALLIVLGTAVLTEHVGLSMAMGAFLAGMLISDSAYKHQILVEIQPFRGILLGFFFMSMGMMLNLDLFIRQPVESLVLVLMLMIFKAVLLFPIAMLFRLGVKDAAAVALFLAQSGEFALVLFALAFQAGLLQETLFHQLLLLVLMSMLMTPAFARLAEHLVQAKKQSLPKEVQKPAPAPVVIAGFGRVGRRIGEILTLAGEPFVALDADAEIVEAGREQGHPVYYGDVRNPELLKSAGASHARVIVITLNDPHAAQQLVQGLRQMHPDTAIYARGHSMSECMILRELGATGVVSENMEASLELAHLAMEHVNLLSDERQAILDEFRRRYRAQIENITERHGLKD